MTSGRWPATSSTSTSTSPTTTSRPAAGSQIGDDVVLEVTAKPHAGCKKFLARFGADAVAFVNSEEGSRLRLRGLNARVVRGGDRPGGRRRTPAGFFDGAQRCLRKVTDSPARVRGMSNESPTAGRTRSPATTGAPSPPHPPPPGRRTASRPPARPATTPARSASAPPPRARRLPPRRPQPQRRSRSKGLAASVVAASLLVGGAAGVGGAAAVDLHARQRGRLVARSSPRAAARPSRPRRATRSRRSPRTCCPPSSRST